MRLPRTHFTGSHKRKKGAQMLWLLLALDQLTDIRWSRNAIVVTKMPVTRYYMLHNLTIWLFSLLPAACTPHKYGKKCSQRKKGSGELTKHLKVCLLTTG